MLELSTLHIGMGGWRLAPRQQPLSNPVYINARPFGERHKMSLAQLERRLVCGKPSFWVENVWVREDIYIVVHQVAAR
jgi:hypothetical protein